MKKLTSTIAGQLIFLIVGVVLLSQLVILWAFFIRTDERVDQYEDRYVAQQIISIYQKVQSTSLEKRGLLLEFSNNSEVSFSITQNPIAQTRMQDPNRDKWFAETLKDTLIYTAEKNISFRDIWYFWFSDDLDECLLNGGQHIGISDDCPYRIFSVHLNENEWLNAKMMRTPSEMVILLPVILAAFLTLAGITVVVVFVVRRITAPLRHLSEAADKLGRGEATQQLDLDGPQELSSTTQVFNVMQERLTRFVQDRTKMLAAISHDLRTPITSLRLNTEFVENEELRGKMVNTLEDMQVMVEACLAFSKQDAQEEESRMIDLVQTLEELAEDSSHIGFSSTVPSYDYLCRSVNIKRAIRNLLENAVKYGKKAHMSFEKSGEQIVIVIQDQGEGIPEDKLEEVFESFVRLDEARNTESGSVGLGLSIARTIIHKHGGTIEAVNIPPGLKMLVTLPLQH